MSSKLLPVTIWIRFPATNQLEIIIIKLIDNSNSSGNVDSESDEKTLLAKYYAGMKLCLSFIVVCQAQAAFAFSSPNEMNSIRMKPSSWWNETRSTLIFHSDSTSHNFHNFTIYLSYPFNNNFPFFVWGKSIDKKIVLHFIK